MRVTDEMRSDLRAAVLELLTEKRQVLRPSEILHHLSADERFMFWTNCMHVAAQLRVLSKRPRRVRRIWMPLHSTHYQESRGFRGGYRGWGVVDLSHVEIAELRSQTLSLREAPPVDVCEVR